MLNTEFSPWPCFSEEEAKAVSRVLLSNKVNYWTGQECREFEKEFAAWSDSEFAVAVGNGTLALDLALKALDIGEGDEVIVTSRTFLASVSCIVTAGATPVFSDVDINTQNIEAHTIESAITPNTKAVIVVHLAGLAADMDPIMKLAKQHNFWVIEDCAQAHGAKYKGKSVGSIGHIGAWSFCQDKIMTTGGEGGMVTTNDRHLWSKMWSYKDHGKSYEAVYERNHPPGFRWLHESFGTNWRMTEMQAVIGRIQLKRMAEWTKLRTANAEMLNKVAAKFDLVKPSSFDTDFTHAFYKYYLFIQPEYLAEEWSRDSIIDYLNDNGVPCFQGSCSEVYLEKAFDGQPFKPKERLANAKYLGEVSLMLLVHPTLTSENMNKTCRVLEQVLTFAQK